MKNKNIIKLTLLIICLISSFAFADKNLDIQSLFLEGNKLYEQGKYEEAINKYNKILDMGFCSGPLYYNLGNASFKLGLLGSTILYYEKAKRLMPRDPELRFNYKYVKSLLKDNINAEKKNWILRSLEKISEFMSFGRWIGYVAFLWLILICMLILIILFPRIRNMLRYAIGIVIICLIFFSICTLINYKIHSLPAAIILPKEVIVRYGPGDAEVEAFILHEGTRVEVVKIQDDWIQVRLADEKTGWLPKNSIGMI